jgi:hypothetical protein
MDHKHETPLEPSDCVGTAYLRSVILLLFAGQVIVGQMLPLQFQRPPSILSIGMLDLMSRQVAFAVCAVLVVLLVTSTFHKSIQYGTTFLFAAFKVFMAYTVWHLDRWVAVYMVLFALAAMAVGASSKVHGEVSSNG